MANNVNRALYIGLGGTGYKILLQVKKALLSNYGEVPPSIRIICFDTDISPLKTHGEELTYIDKTGKKVTKEVKFDPSERVEMPVKNPQKLLKFKHIDRWLSQKIKPMIGPGDNGAKQVRSQGRFAFFENYNSKNLRGIVEQRIGSIMSGELGKNIDYNIMGSPRIHFVFSPCGGTGAGTFMDMVMNIKVNPKFEGIETYAWMVMPDFYTVFPMTNNVVRNSYASLMEIDHMMGKDATEENPWSNYYKKEYEVDYVGSGNLTSLGSNKLFDYIYLFDDVNEKGEQITEINDVYDRIGRILYLMVSGPGDLMLTSYSNNKDYLYPSSPETGGKRRNYSSMGMSQIILDKDFLKDLKSTKMYKSILYGFIHSNEPLSEREFDTFIDSNSLREDKGQDQVIDKLMPRTDLNFDIESAAPTDYKKGSSEEIAQSSKLFLDEWEGKISKTCEENLQIKLNEFQDALDNQLDKYISNPGGLVKTKGFITYVIGSFDGMREEMNSESQKHKINYEKLQDETPLYIEAISEAEDGFSLFGNKSSKIKEACGSLLNNTERMVFQKWEYIRKSTAKLFYDKCIAYLTNKKAEIQTTDNLIDETLSFIEKETQRLNNMQFIEKDFERYIHQFYKNVGLLQKEDINLQEAFQNIDFKSILKCKSVDDIINILMKYITITEVIKEVDELTVEKILKDLPQDVLDNIIQYMDTQSSACINIDAESFLQNTAKPTMEKFGYLCVENNESNLFDKEGEIYSKLSADGGYARLETCSTGDPNKITLIKIAGMFPACAINKIKSHKIDYELSMSRGGYHFSDVYFEKFAMDLVDAPSDESEKLKWFTVGSALGLISLHKGGIYLDYENRKKVPLFSGSRGKTDRSKCFKYFAENDDYSNYIEQKFDFIWAEKGKPHIADLFVSFYNNIDKPSILGKKFETIQTESSEYDQIFEERKVILDFAISSGIAPERFEIE